MIAEYLQAEMRRPHYEMIEDAERFYSEIPGCLGVWVTGASLEECRQQLFEALEGSVILSLHRNFALPEQDGTSLVAQESSVTGS